MPLTATTITNVTSDEGQNAIGFWMTVKGAEPVEAIRIRVPYNVLAQIEPSRFRGLPEAFQIFDENRERIENAASNKFDSIGFDEGEYEGRPVLVVRFGDYQNKVSADAPPYNNE